jgi:uncharacterized membrane protein
VGAQTIIAGIAIPSTSPLFLAGVGFHVIFALAAVASGAAAMLSPKRAGRHPRFGGIYLGALIGAFVTASALAAARWAADYDLILLGGLSVAAAVLGRVARRRGWLRAHMSGMGLSYIAMLTAFYVDNGKSLPIWRDLPPIAYWTAPSVVGLPLLFWALWRHPLVRAAETR